METGRTLEWRFSLHHVLLVLLMAAIFCASVTRVLGLDIWWHLAVGKYLLSTRSFPAHDVFSFTGASWDNKEWLFGILVYLVHRAGGAELMTLVKSALFTATFFVLYLLSVKRSGNRYLSLGVVLLAALACRVRLAFRPELLSWLFMAILLLLIEEFWEGRKRPLCFFPLLMLAWVNLHPLAFVGLAILAIHLVGGIARAALPVQAEKHGWRRPRPGDLGLLALILSASCIALRSVANSGANSGSQDSLRNHARQSLFPQSHCFHPVCFAMASLISSLVIVQSPNHPPATQSRLAHASVVDS